MRPAWTEQLRAHEGGRLKSQQIGGAEFPPYLYQDGKVKPEFSEVCRSCRPDQIPPEQPRHAVRRGQRHHQLAGRVRDAQRRSSCASTTGSPACSRAEYPSWDDERLFQTARNILIVLLIKIVIEEYINHITPYHFQLARRPGAVQERALVPPELDGDRVQPALPLARPDPVDAATSPGRDEPIYETVFNPALVVEHGLARLFEDASRQRAGRVGLFNTDPALREVELAEHPRRPAPCNSRPTTTTASWRSSRASPTSTRSRATPRCRPACAISTATSTGSSSSPACSPRTRARTRVLPSLIGRMVGVDAFSQALTNPLLAPRVFNEGTFSAAGHGDHRRPRARSPTSCTATSRSPRANYLVTMTREGWKRV